MYLTTKANNLYAGGRAITELFCAVLGGKLTCSLYSKVLNPSLKDGFSFQETDLIVNL